MSNSEGDRPEASSACPRKQETESTADDYLDQDFVSLQKSLSQKRRTAKECMGSRIQKMLPFPFSPIVRPLTISDLESCIALENAAFSNPEHRASPEKFEYRLATCPELSIGVFCTASPQQTKDWDIETLSSARPVETDRTDKAVSVMLAHIVGTLCCGETITDADMDIPKDWSTRGGKAADVGHQPTGRTVACHCLAVSPKVQVCGVGKMIMKSFIQQVRGSGLADRISLICQDYLISYYERHGFKHKGESKAEFGGGGWHDMVLELSPPKFS